MTALALVCALAQVLFAVETNLGDDDAGVSAGLLPLGCFDPARGLVGGAACLTLVPPQAQVESAHGKLRVTGRGDVTCALDGEAVPGLRVAGEPPSGLAGWPKLEVRTPKGRVANAAELAAVTARLRASELLRSRTERVAATVWRADFDGRGSARLVAAGIGRGHDDEGPRVGALLLVRDGAAPLLLAHEADAGFTLLGLTDLDGDRHPELVLGHRYFEGGSISLERLTADKLERIGTGPYCGT